MCGETQERRVEEAFGNEGVADVVRKSRLGWFGHLGRKDAGDWVSACRNMTIVGRNTGKGITKKRWNEVVNDDLKKCGLDRGLAKDREINGSSYGENVRLVRAWTRDVRQGERES